MERKPTSDLSSRQQSVCIDLPGEMVTCWRSTDKVQVILRKHRDVIFDISLASRKTYTVESNGSDFYHANEKKLIAGKGRQRVQFNDGDRLHLWVSRDFNGELVLKSGATQMIGLGVGQFLMLSALEKKDKTNIRPS